MAIPSVNQFANEPGGGLVTAMGGINKLSNDNILRQINAIKKQYAPLTTQAEAASKLAYANLMGPQFMAKLLGNDSAIANMGSDQAKAAIQQAVNAGMGGGSANNIFAQMQQQSQSPGEKMGNSLSNFFAEKLKGVFGGQGQPGIGQMQMPGQGQPQQQTPQQMPFSNSGEHSEPMAPPMGKRPKDGVTLEGQQWYNAKGEPVYEEDVNTPDGSMKLELTKGIPPKKTYAENTGEYKGIVEEGANLGAKRADAIAEIGEQQMNLSNTGANLDRIIEDINDPKFIELRKDFPFYQDMQLTALSKIGSPEQQEMIGNFIADVKSYAGSTVNSFKGASMKREFDYADQLKPNENDTVNTARGKLTALKTLKEIAERKNDIILDLMQDQHMNFGDAVKVANKMVDVKKITQDVRKLTSPMITLKDPKNPGITIRLPLWEARQRGVKNV